MNDATKNEREPRAGRERPPLPPRTGQDRAKVPGLGVGCESPSDRLTRNRPTGRGLEA